MYIQSIYGKTPLEMHFHRTLVERIPKQPNWTPLIFVKNMVSVFMLSCMILKKILGFWRSGRVQKNASPVNTATISVICLQVLPNNKPYAEAKDAYN